MTRLYINGMLADLGADADGLLLFTYAAGDLDNPAVVQNAYTKEVVLPPTNRNARIFGNAERPDKVAGADDAFNTLARTPFVLKGESGEVLESGYVKLEGVSADGYTLHLFGGLGSFLYGLMYGEDGSKKSLASLYYGDGIDGGLSFNINATIVQAAWNRLAAYYDTIESAYDVVNFAPMHNGRPSDFDCGKGLIPVGGAHGCPIPAGATESGKGGYALVEFGRDFDEWEVRDLRSYLQRPVFNLRALFTALENERNNGGYTFDWSGIANEWFASAWMTLPMLNVQGITQEDTPLTLFWDSASFLPPFAPQQTRIDMAEALPSGTKVSVNLGLSLQLYHDGIGGAVSKAYIGVGGLDTYIFLRLAAYDSGDNKVAESPLRCLCRANPMYSPFVAAKHLAGVVPSGEQYYSPVLGYISEDSIEQQAQGELTIPANGEADTDAIGLSLVGYDISYLKFSVACVSVARGGVWSASDAKVIAYDAQGESHTTDVNRIDAQEGYASAIAESAGRVRSGAYISKADLLGGTASPAELLLSFVKTFGLVLAYDGVTRTIRVLERGGFYTGETIDLTARIDRSQPVRVVPNGIEAKWLNFSHQQALGAFAERYAAKYGAQYGAQRVNTGSPFNADTLEVLEGVGFVAGVTGLAYSRYFYLLKDSAVGTGVLPSPYLDNNCKYTLWDTATGEAKQHDIKGLDNAALLTDINAVDEMDAPGYDGFYRLALAGADGSAAADGANILLFHDSTNRELAHLTDDTTAMLNANDGKPCWIPCLDSTPQLYVPAFVSYRFARSWGGAILDSLDMGTPREVDMPTMVYDEGKSIYARRWAAYIRDRYSENAHRVTARVDLRGMQVGQALLGNFFYFDGCVWVLEKITDWCWDMQEPCECVFVRVLDKGAYTNGQN